MVPSVLICIMQWQPRCLTATIPIYLMIMQTSLPERTRSLPNGNLNLRDKDLVAQAPRYL